MPSITINPNPYDCKIEVSGGGGGALNANQTVELGYTLKVYSLVSTPMPHYEWSHTRTELTTVTTKSGIDGFVRWGAVMGGISNMPVDGTLFSTSFETIKAWDGESISNIQYDQNVWDLPASCEVSEDYAEGTSTSGIHEVSGVRCWYSAWGWGGTKAELTMHAPCPVFATEEDLDDYLRTGDASGAITPIDPEQEPNVYKYYIYNTITRTIGAGYDAQYFYRYAMSNENDRLCFYLNENAGELFDRTLIGVEGIGQIYEGENALDDPFPMASSTVVNFLGKQKKFESGTIVTPIMYETNIPTFDTQAHAEQYILTGDETGMIDKWRESGIQPGEIGEPVDSTPQGENGAVFTFGGGMFRMSSAKMASFYSEVFNTDPNVIDSILDGLKLFGTNQIGAIQDVMYIPFSANLVCSSISNDSTIILGGYQMSTTGDRINKNDRLINMGSHYFAPPYGAGDFRNYEPACRIYLMLPYAGTHELQVSKYIGKNIGLKLAVDLTTGNATYFVYGNNAIYDSFDCVIGAHRPLTAVDHAQHVSASTNAILSTLTPIGSAVSSATAGDPGGVAESSGRAILNGYQAMNILSDPPMRERGSFSGFVGMFDITSPYFVFAQQQPVQPSNLVQIAGKPSSAGGIVGSFAGYLETCQFLLADGFTGTEEEAEEIRSLMQGGVYID